MGGLGFIGQNLIEELKEDYRLVVFGRSKNHNSPDYIYCHGDFTNRDAVETVFKKHRIDLVIHAISTTIPASADPIIDIDSNLKSTVHLLELLKQYNVSKIVFLSSGGTVYGLINELDSVPENHPTYPISAHGITKLAIEKYLYLYQRLYNLNYLILRLSNPFGEHHSSDKQGLINITLKKIIKKEPMTVWGNGEIIRDYIYVKDCVKIIHQLIDKNISNQIINVGSNQGYSINEILAIIRNLIGNFEIIHSEYRNYDVPKIVLDTSKLKSLIDFELTPLNKSIQNTCRWLKQTYA